MILANYLGWRSPCSKEKFELYLVVGILQRNESFREDCGACELISSMQTPQNYVQRKPMRPGS